jgi:gliding motility-associated-like protein
VVTNGTVLSIQSNSIFYDNGNFTNNGTVVNNGNLSISGAWTNTGTYQAGTGQMTFNGTGTQVINHDAQSISKLVISGGGEKLFTADISIEQELSLQQGILATNNQSKIILDQQATVVGGSDSSYVQAVVYNTGTGMKLFPVGINSHYTPVTLTDVTGSTPVVGVQVFEPNPNSTFDKSLVAVSPLRYWQITALSGSFDGSPVTLPLIGEDFSQSIENAVVGQAAGASDPFQSLGVSSVNGDFQSGSITSNDPVTLAWVAVATVESPNRDILVYNAVTPNGDGKHDFLKMVNIEYYPNNQVTIVNRYGQTVFEMDAYNNVDRFFSGEANTGGLKTLTNGTYFYVIDKRNGDKKISGFFILTR